MRGVTQNLAPKEAARTCDALRLLGPIATIVFSALWATQRAPRCHHCPDLRRGVGTVIAVHPQGGITPTLRVGSLACGSGLSVGSATPPIPLNRIDKIQRHSDGQNVNLFLREPYN